MTWLPGPGPLFAPRASGGLGMTRSIVAVATALILGALSSTAAADETPAPGAESEHGAQTVLGSGIHHGVYGAPEAKVTVFTGDAAMLVGGHAGWVIDRRFVLGLAGYGLATAY